MPSEDFREVYRTLREGQNRYTYFLLAAAGAAIALVINQTQAADLSYTQIPLAAGVVCWALSFFFGCRHVAYANSTTYSHLDLLLIESGRHPTVGPQPDHIQAASQGLRSAMERNSEIANQLSFWQFRLLVVSGVLYIVWHVIEMYVRTVS